MFPYQEQFLVLGDSQTTDFTIPRRRLYDWAGSRPTIRTDLDAY